MASWAYVAAFVALLSSQSACTSIDLEEREELGSQSQQISAQDSIVLCPVAAAVDSSASIDGLSGLSVVWAGYPPDDDRLQLIRARVSPEGKLISSQAIAFLDGDLTALELRNLDSRDESRELELEFVDSELGALRVLRLSKDGGARELEVSESSEANWSAAAWKAIDSDEQCQTSINLGTREMTVFRSQADGELSLFVQSR